VGQQAGLGEHERAHRSQILDGRTVPQPVERLARGRMHRFRPIAQREERLPAAARRAQPRDLQDLVRAEIGIRDLLRAAHERAVAAGVPAKARERDEDLARVAHARAVARFAQASRLRQQHRRRQSIEPRQGLRSAHR
jgi:hypothetical protein